MPYHPARLAAALGAVLLAAASPAAATVTFTADYTLIYSVSAHVEPDGGFVSQAVPPVSYNGSFQFQLGPVSEVITSIAPGQQLRTLDVGLTFQPFDFAPDLLAQVNAQALNLPVNTETLQGFIRTERLETTAGDLIAIQGASNAFYYDENRFSLPLGDIQSLSRSVRANQQELYTSVGGGLAGTSPDDIAPISWLRSSYGRLVPSLPTPARNSPAPPSTAASTKPALCASPTSPLWTTA